MIEEENIVGQAPEAALAIEAAILPATYTNRFVLTLTRDAQIRLAFLEQDTHAKLFVGRSAVIMSAEIASALADLINKMVQKVTRVQ